MGKSLFWFRRDLRLGDNPALANAIANGDETLVIFHMDADIWNRAGEYRNAYLTQSLKELSKSLSGNLLIVSGDLTKTFQEIVKKYNIDQIHAAKQYAPFGVNQEVQLEKAGFKIEFTGSPYAIAPGRVQKPDGGNYRVYTPFYKAWVAHGWRKPIAVPDKLNLISPLKKDQVNFFQEVPKGVELQTAGEAAALARFEEFKKNGLNQYDEMRNYPGVKGVSRLSPHLRWGEIHPRTLLADLKNNSAHEVFRKEIAWREFYADVLHHYPHTTRDYYSPKYAEMRYEKPDGKFKAWCEGKTGFPIVDAGMRQLLAEGWMHNRVRMIVASFLVKDLHLEWHHGANYFMKYLIDNDVASNSHGWQWTAGCGTDASPYYRIFNPIEQGRKFDPEGTYIKKYVPELREVPVEEIHEPHLSNAWKKSGYVKPIVDHALERKESLARLAEIKEN